MELRRYLHLIRRKLPIVIVSIIIGVIVGYFTTPKQAYYRTTAQIYVGSREIAQDQSLLYLEPGLDQIVDTYAEMIPSPVIAQKAIEATGVSRSVGTVVSETAAAVVVNTNLIDVFVKDPNPVVAQQLANGISNAFVNQIKAYDPAQAAGPGSLPSEPAYVFQDAGLPVTPLPIHTQRAMLLGAIFGLIISIVLVLILDYVDITVRAAEDLERRLDLPVLGVIPMRSSVPEKVNVG